MIDDLETHKASVVNLDEKMDELHGEFTGAGYSWRGLSTRKFPTPHSVSVFTRGDRLIRVKRYADRLEVAAFDDEGFLCPVSEAL